MRSFARNWPTILDRVVRPLRADCFVTTWDSVGFGVGYERDSARILPPELVPFLPAPYRDATALLARFPTLAKALTEVIAPSSTVLAAAAGITAWRVHDEREFEGVLGGKFGDLGALSAVEVNTLKMYFGMSGVLALLDDHVGRGDGYDVVIRMRPDMHVEDFCAAALRHGPFESRTVYVNHYHPLGVSDQFAFGRLEAMRVYMGVWDSVATAGTLQPHPFGYPFTGESPAFDQLAAAGALCRRLSPISYNLSSQVFRASEVAGLLLQDLDAGNELSATLRDAVLALIEPSGP